MLMRTSEIFDLLRDGRGRTRSELSRESGLARSSVALHIETLIQVGYVTPVGDAASTGGRPASLFAFNPGARLVIGVDVGATHVIVELADLSGEGIAASRADIDVAEGPEAVLGWVEQAIRGLVGQQDRALEDVVAVGIGLPGPVEHATGMPISPPIMPGWHRFDVAGWLRQRLGCPVLVDNDVNIMALGEQRTAWPDTDDLVLVKIATGIGAGIISGGRLQRGARGTAGDLGHVRVPGSSAPCRCGNEGCLEAVAAGPAIAAKLRALGVEVSGTADVVALAAQGSVDAAQVLRAAGRDIGEVLATVVNLVNPSVIVVAGRLAGAAKELHAGISEVVYRRSLPLATEHLQIAASATKGDAGVRGAVVLAIEHALSPEVLDAELPSRSRSGQPVVMRYTS
ncbi:ROK family transcriptional regulator [Agrococcus sp. ARC_14]|uniref:ROK family transcriptional regulator n=1 Tax=Agrococcus sp. ARC_14 TaxID=2919927 RepID=UPI001F070D51|nr:ROK family transcriptional regulator [Agrococcus sp. ARC_14]MCH1883061.1 ROK family protein [Agrococcus sp. ARC_14]